MRDAPSIPRLNRRLRAACGTELAYDVRGPSAQTPSLVLTNGLTTTTSFFRYLAPRWEQGHRVLSWDLPGHGASGPARSPQSANIAEQPEHLVQLMDAAQIDRAVQVGWSTGCQVVLELYRRYPARCSGLVLLLGSAGHVLSTARLPLPGQLIDRLVRGTPAPIFHGLVRAMAHAAHAPLGQLLPRALDLIGAGTSHADAALITAHLRSLDTPTVQAMIASAQAHTAWDMLETIDVPVLIVAGDRDRFAPADTVGVEMHARCPDAELRRLPEGTHTALFDHAEVIGDAVDDFLARRVQAGRFDSPGTRA